MSAITESQSPLMSRTSGRLLTARKICSAEASRFSSPEAVARADWVNWARAAATSMRARAIPWKMLTRAMGSRAMVMMSCRRRRRVQPRSAAGALTAALLGRLAGAELVQLRHDLTGRVSLGGPCRITQPVFAVQNVYQSLAGARHPAFHRADGAFADGGRVLIGEAARAHQNKSLALFVGKTAQRPHRVGQLGRINLILGAAGNAFGGVLVPRRLAPGAAAVGIELVAQNGEQPGLEVGAGNEGGAALPGLHQCLLRQIVGRLRIAGQRASEGAQERHQPQQLILE